MKDENEEKWVNHIKKYCHTDDPEYDHIEADKALTLFLLSLGYKKIVKEWKKVEKWYA